jgi:FkbM family methyltransferase
MEKKPLIMMEHIIRLLCGVGWIRDNFRIGRIAFWYGLRQKGYQWRLADMTGYKLWVNIAEPLGVSAYFLKVDLPPPHLRSVFRPGMIFWDIGANMGGWTCYAASKMKGQGTATAFEPNPKINPWVQRSLEASGFAGFARVERRAVWRESNSTLTFHMGAPSNSGISYLESGHSSDASSVTVDTVTLDDFALEQGVEHVRFAKIDVERTEDDLILGASKVLGKHLIDLIFMELIEGAGSIGKMRSFGYTAYIFEDAVDAWRTYGNEPDTPQMAQIDVLFVSPHISWPTADLGPDPLS